MKFRAIAKLVLTVCSLGYLPLAYGNVTSDPPTILYGLFEIEGGQLGENAELLPMSLLPADALSAYVQWPSNSEFSFAAPMARGYWAKVETTSAKSDTLLLSQGSPGLGAFRQATAYMFHNDSLYRTAEIGLSTGRSHAYVFEWPAGKGENVMLLRLQNWQPGILLRGKPETLPLFRLAEPPPRLRQFPRQLLWTGAFYGAILIQVFYFLASFLISREPINLYYALTFGSFAGYLFFELHAHLLFPAWEAPFHLFSITGGFLSSSFLLLFAHAFLRLGARVRPLVYGYLVLRAMIFVLALTVLYGWQQPYSAASLDKAGSYLGAILLGYLLYQAARRSTLPKYYFVSLGLIVLVMLGSALAVFGIEPDLNLAFVNTFMLMALLPLGLFALATGYRVYTIKQEKDRAEQLRQADQQKRAIYADIAHEFRDPLTLILGHSDGNSVVGRQAQELLELSEQIMELEAVDGSLEPTEPESVDLKMLLGDIAASYRSGQRSLTVEWPEEELVAFFDPRIVGRIIRNLLSNAAKYSNEDDPILLQLSMNRQDQRIELRVTDYGMGIPQQEQAYIFDRFFRGQHTASRRGTGIGLSFAKVQARRCGGDLRLERSDSTGSTFCLSLPVASQSHPFKQSTALPVGQEAADFPGLLIVEDNHSVASYIGRCFAGEYRLHYADNGRRGLEMAERLLPDIVITDIVMPEMDGRALCEALKKGRATSHIPVIMLSGRAQRQDRIAGRRSGADQYLTKPFTKAELRLTVSNTLRQQDEMRQALLETVHGEVASSGFRQNEKWASEASFLQEVNRVVQRRLEQEGSLSTGAVAEELSMSYSSLYRKIKALTNKTPAQYFAKLRCLLAGELLANSDLSVSEVAYRCGFSSPSYFSQVFKREMGKSPQHFTNER